MKCRYYFAHWRRECLCNYLEQHDIPYEFFGNDEFMKFSIWSTHKDCELMVKDVYRLTGCTPQISAHYSEKELAAAQLLAIRTKSPRMCIVNEDDSFRYDCSWESKVEKTIIYKAHHQAQIGTIMISKEPSATTKTVFWGPDDGGNILFADKKVYDLVQQENLKGIDFQDVILKNRKPSERVFQMLAEHVVQTEDIVWGKGETEKTCPMCGKKQYALPYVYHLHLFDSPIYHENDFFSTSRIFGDGIAQPMYIISQRFYRLLKENKFTKQVEFTPVILV